MEKVFFGLGSNLGDRARYLQQARDALTDLPLQEFQASAVYESLPLANMDQPFSDWEGTSSTVNISICIQGASQFQTTGLDRREKQKCINKRALRIESRTR